MLGTGSLRLYQRLLDQGIARWDDAPVDGPDDARLAELVPFGPAQVTDHGVVAVRPSAARAQVAVEVYRQARGLLAGAADVDDFLEAWSAADGAGAPSATDVVRLVRDYSEVRALSGTLQRHARHKVLSIHTARVHDPSDRRQMVAPAASDIAAGVSYRVIYLPEFVADDTIRSVIEVAMHAGEQARVHPDPPLRLKIIDGRESLLPIDETGGAGALIIRSRPICGLLVDHFERLWKESTPYGQTRRPGHRLDPLQQRMLRMLAKDMTDAEIADALRVTDRTVRRHVAAVLNGLGARTRAGAVAVALRKGMLG